MGDKAQWPEDNERQLQQSPELVTQGVEPGCPVCHFIGSCAQHHYAGSMSAERRHLQSHHLRPNYDCEGSYCIEVIFLPVLWDQTSGLKVRSKARYHVTCL